MTEAEQEIFQCIVDKIVHWQDSERFANAFKQKLSTLMFSQSSEERIKIIGSFVEDVFEAGAFHQYKSDNN